MRRLMLLYKIWALDMHPLLSFEDVTRRLERMGGKFRHKLMDLREAEFFRANAEGNASNSQATDPAAPSKNAAAPALLELDDSLIDEA